jgi:hypothetical protein
MLPAVKSIHDRPTEALDKTWLGIIRASTLSLLWLESVEVSAR